MSNRGEYVYVSLQSTRSIRLAIVAPGEPCEALQVRLKEQSLDEALDYEAVSYCWGEGKREYPIMCDGGLINVTRNLVEALYRFRRLNNHRVLWIDTLCINQNDLEERNQQVKIMGEVYKKATRVVIWLGEEDSTTGLAYKSMRALWAMSENMDEKREKAIVEIQDKNELCESLKIPLPGSPELQALESLWERRWFFRAWVYQESILARESIIVTGSHEIVGYSMLFIFKSVLAIEERADMPRYTFASGVFNAWKMFLPWKGRMPSTYNFWEELLSLLQKRRAAQAYDPRDIIYSLLSIAACQGLPELDPDYNMPWEDVYISTARQIMIGTGNLNILGSASGQSTRNSNSLPSWVPDWREQIASGVLFHTSKSKSRKYYDATGSSVPKFEKNNDPRRLRIRGLSFVEITHTGVGPVGPQNFPEFADFFNGSSTYGPTKERMPLAAIRLLCRDSSFQSPSEEFRTSNRVSDFPSAKDYEEYLNGTGSSTVTRALAHGVTDRKLFLTTRGYFGIGPHNVKAGDKVYLLLGAEVPTILRKEDDEYTLVGECYVHGLMNGEGLHMARKIADPNYDFDDTAWLSRVHEEDIPLYMEEVVIR